MKKKFFTVEICLNIFFIFLLIFSLYIVFANVFSLLEPELKFIFIKQEYQGKIINCFGGILGIFACLDGVNREKQKTKNFQVYTLIVVLLSLL